MDTNIITFPLDRRGIAVPAGQNSLAQDLLRISEYLHGVATDTPYRIWMEGLASEVRRVAVQMSLTR